MTKLQGLLVTIVAASLIAGMQLTTAQAQTLVEEWDTAKLPPPPSAAPPAEFAMETDLQVGGRSVLLFELINEDASRP